MKIVVSDLTGRTLNYDYALCNALSDGSNKEDIVEFWGPKCDHNENLLVKSFGSIVPPKYKTSTNGVIRLFKAIDAVFAYIKTLFLIVKRKPDIIHLQWFPFLSLGLRGGSIDIFFMKIIKIFSPKTKGVFTIHNMCPHGMAEKDRINYNPIFSKALKYFDHYIVHTEKSKKDAMEAFDLKENCISVVYHGVFKPKGITFEKKEWDDNCVNLIMYGSQSWYKGTDVFIEALALLPEDVKTRIKVTVCGCIDQDIKEKCESIITGCDITWMSYYLDDATLYSKINEADIILLPYRRISQSGVLLLAIPTKRIIITSDLPTFKETLKGYNNDMFFESENPQSLANVICNYLNGRLDRSTALDKLEKLEGLYSWEESSKKTMMIYKNLVGG